MLVALVNCIIIINTTRIPNHHIVQVIISISSNKYNNMAQSRKRLKTAHDNNVGDVVLGETPLLSLGDDLLIGICIHLQSNDLASISSTCKHFGEKLEQYNNEHSLMEFIGKQIVEDYASVEEKLLLQQQEESNGILLYDRLLMLRTTLLFEQLIGQGLDYVGTNKARVLLPVITGTAMHTMISNKITTALSGGKHYAKFTVHGGGEVSCVFLFV